MWSLGLGLGDTGRDQWGHWAQGCGCLRQMSSQLPLEDVGWGAGRRFHSGMERLKKEFFSSVVLPDLVLSLRRCFFPVLESLSSRLSISLVIPTSSFMIVCMKDSCWCFLHCSSVGHFNWWWSLVTLAGWQRWTPLTRLRDRFWTHSNACLSFSRTDPIPLRHTQQFFDVALMCSENQSDL